MEITDIEMRRAENLIWTAAEDYGFSPDFKAFCNDGSADIYWNFIIGAVRKFYDYKQFETVFRSFSEYEDSFVYESLFWLGLENAVFPKASRNRPALQSLRIQYAINVIKAYSGIDDFRLYDALADAHFRRVLGMKTCLNGYSISLLDEIEFSESMTSEEIVKKTKEIFWHWFNVTVQDKNRQKKRFFKGFNKGTTKGRKPSGRFKRFGIGYADRPQNCYGGADASEVFQKKHIATKLTEKELRQFMESKFGASLYSELESKLLETALCRENHEGCHLLITDGRNAGFKLNNGFEALERQREILQRDKNRQNFKYNSSLYLTAIIRLKEKVQNSILMYLQESAMKGQTGTLDSRIAWRGEILSDERIFYKNYADNSGSLSVDILLDGSTSQKNRQESVSAQAYIIAEALTQCGIPCRIMSFCSMTGFTIIKIFRDYCMPEDNEKVFDFVANGCNRDGLAIRTANYLLKRSSYENRILIILSDVKPNDVIKIRTNGDEEYAPYEAAASVNDTAIEVRKARADDNAIICVFTGEDDDVDSARLVYGSDLVRIKSIDRLADAVGTILVQQFCNM